MRLSGRGVTDLRRGQPVTVDDGEAAKGSAPWWRVGEVVSVAPFGHDPLYAVVASAAVVDGRWAIELRRAA
jgi:hypothetical protein